MFDDVSSLQNGSLFKAYGSLLDIKQRMVSYGSFIWVEHLAGPGFWKQRLVNVALHLAAVAALYALLRSLFALTRFPDDIESQPHFVASRTAALQVGTALFALHPVAVYAVGYLIQRSILMATLFALLACLAWVRALTARRWPWYGLAVLCYALAVLSKEHAVMTAALAIPLYIYVRRPGWKSIAAVAGSALLLLAVAAAVLLNFYGSLVGQLFDAQSRAFAQQLDALRPGVSQHMYPLSIMNQAALFFGYGLRWLVPYLGWLSIDLRPAFPWSSPRGSSLAPSATWPFSLPPSGCCCGAPARRAWRACSCSFLCCGSAPNSPPSGCRIRSCSTAATSGPRCCPGCWPSS